MEPMLSDFLDHILKLAKECERKEYATDFGIIKDIHSRLKYCISALNEIKTVARDDNTLGVNETDLNDLVICLEAYEKEWKLKVDSARDTHPKDPFQRFKAEKKVTHEKGRPMFDIDVNIVTELRSIGLSLKKVSEIIGVHRTTLYRRLTKLGINTSRHEDLSEQEIDIIVKEIKSNHPFSGERMLAALLNARSVYVTRAKLRESIHRVDPINTALRWVRKNPRSVYSVPGPNSLWHNDGLHKLIHWRFVVHSCIDGFSRLITSSSCADNNRSDTCLAAFLGGVERWGLPSRVRGDYGSENNGIEAFMKEHRGESGYIRGPSVHNQRIERLHYDTTHCVLAYFKKLFLFMEDTYIMCRYEEVDLFALHFVFLPRIVKSLNEFVEAWNIHAMSSVKNKTPLQNWTLGMMDVNNEERRAVRDFVHGEHLALFGTCDEATLHEDNYGEEESTVEVRRIDIGDKQDEVALSLDDHFDPLQDDGNHGIDTYVAVKEYVVRYIS